MILVATVQALVAEVHGTPVAAMVKPDGRGARNRPEVYARQEAMFLCRDMLSVADFRQQPRIASLPSIGKRFGNRDHSTVHHALKAVAHRIATDDVVRRRIDSVSVRLLIGEAV